ncbi:MAG: metallophosphoesterase [Anaerolineae bacterium]
MSDSVRPSIPKKEQGATAKHRYVRRVAWALDVALAQAMRRVSGGERRALDIVSDRYMIFSDLHRGARNGADDFQRSERAYNAALAYYYKLGHTLVLLGDVEELWEERPEPVLEAYEHAIELEARYHHEGRYIRLWGNHDDMWQYKDAVKSYLAPLYGSPPLRVHESLLLDIQDGDEKLGELFLIHGHQGDLKADQWAWLAKLVIRYIWRPIQRLTDIMPTTPATSWNLTHKLNQAMYAWAEKKPRLVMMAGHTHEPAFKSQSLEAQIEDDLIELRRTSGDSPSPAQIEAEAELMAQLEWVRTQSRDKPKGEFGIDFAVPCYFNTGCSCYPDGDITGIEIVEGEIRLIRWPNEEEDPLPQTLARDDIREVLASV